MIRIFRAVWDGTLLRCPRCRRGRMFSSFFTMRRECPVCGLVFERSSGEITGGMGINISVTLTIVIIGALWIGLDQSLPLLPLLFALLIAGGVIFPILFYPISRGMWAGILYLTGDNDEPD